MDYPYHLGEKEPKAEDVLCQYTYLCTYDSRLCLIFHTKLHLGSQYT